MNLSLERNAIDEISVCKQCFLDRVVDLGGIQY